MKPNEENSSSREIHQEVHTDATNGHVSTTRTTTSVPSTAAKVSKEAAHHQGYVQGEMAENHRQVGVQEVRDNENAGRGLLLGILLASLAGLVLGSVYYFNRGEEAPTPTAAPVIVVPKANQPSATPAPTRTIEKETTIIQKIVPVPVQASPVQKATPAPQPTPAQKAAPAPQANPAPNINITVPNSQRQDAPAKQAAPAPAPSSPSNNINLTVPNTQNEPASTPQTSAPESSTTPSPTQNEGASGAGTGSETNTERSSDSNPTDTAVPDSNSGAGGAGGSQK
ncbi:MULTISPECIES: hypothetical protein [unclassified Microcoleus]|uniref:hypothetical protein n=1 Tax=unclassified Microcoleus TaxID=2642155 RepID=UPI002FD3AA71